jgi:hypothetical protein
MIKAADTGSRFSAQLAVVKPVSWSSLTSTETKTNSPSYFEGASAVV